MKRKLHPASLWIGSDQQVRDHALALMRQTFCKNSCGSCVDCTALAHTRHHALTWLVPENYYTVKQIDELFLKIRFALQPGEHHFIVIERADLLTVATANSLLKALEEPFEGYHYILLAPRMHGILPTIKSRCVIEEFLTDHVPTHRLLPFFTEFSCARADELMKELEKNRVPEREIEQLLDGCMQYWQKQLRNALDTCEKRASYQRMCDELIAARKHPPMPGSSKLFLKNLFLRMALVVP